MFLISISDQSALAVTERSAHLRHSKSASIMTACEIGHYGCDTMQFVCVLVRD